MSHLLFQRLATDSLSRVRFWPSRARQLSELLALKQPFRTQPQRDCSRAMNFAEWIPAPGHEQTLTKVRLRRPQVGRPGAG